MKTVGLIVNPVAGMGGKVGLKGSDGPEVLRLARELGATPEAPQRVSQALAAFSGSRDRLQWIACPGDMGEDVCRRAGLDPLILGSVMGRETTWEDTERAAGELLHREVDLLLFAGGDGTARNVCKAVGSRLVTLGIPAGVKIHSAVYAVTPRDAGEVARRFLEGGLRTVREGEVMDIDEESYRQGVVEAKLYGYLRVPVEDRHVQRMKAGGVASEAQALAGMAEEVVDGMQESEVFVIGTRDNDPGRNGETGALRHAAGRGRRLQPPPGWPGCLRATTARADRRASGQNRDHRHRRARLYSGPGKSANQPDPAPAGGKAGPAGGGHQGEAGFPGGEAATG